jgi:hypothetical protein
MPLQILHEYNSIPDCLPRTMYHHLSIEYTFCDVIKLRNHSSMAVGLTDRMTHNLS